MKPLALCQLYAFVDTAYLGGRPPELVARQLCDGGADLIQLRAKDWSADHIKSTAEQLLQITQRADVHLVINDHWDIAATLGAPFCHLGQEDFFDAALTHVSQLHRPSIPTLPRSTADYTTPTRLGLSSHAPPQAQRAIAAGAAYIAIGPVYATGTKPTARPVTLEYVRWAATHVAIPWFAIGGITLENLDAVLAAGARRICVVSAILNAPDIARACAQFKSRLPIISAPA